MKRERKPPPPATVRIEGMGAGGDGVAHLADGTPLYIPLTLPREQVAARPVRPRGEGWQAQAETLLESSPERVVAPCGHFGQCGGCALQHWQAEPYGVWKAGLLRQALRQAGFPQVEEIVLRAGQPAERRRMDFAVRRDGGRLILGLHAAHAAAVVALSGCVILHPVLNDLLPHLRRMLSGLTALRREGSVIVNLLDSGPDLLLRTDGTPNLDDRMALAGFATRHGLPRISWAGRDGETETIAAPRPAATKLAGVEVRPPPGAFMQATAAGEAAIAEAVMAGLPKLAGRSRIAELYAGCGTLTFALAKAARVAAWEGDGGAVAALKQAANHNGLAGRIETFERDLARQPLTAKELAAFAAIVLDPPHAGAAAQIGQIAASGVPRVIYVSCNPVTLGRDARVLASAGYRLEVATAIDQFLWSPRLEAVCVFQR